MAIVRPQRFASRGLVWQITGTPYRRRTRIRLLRQGRYRTQLDVGMRRRAARDLTLRLRRNTPIDTGALRQSGHNEGDAAILGPRRRPVDNSKFYALPANRRSRRPAYIERSINQTSRDMVGLLNEQQGAERDMFDLAGVLAGRPIRR